MHCMVINDAGTGEIVHVAGKCRHVPLPDHPQSRHRPGQHGQRGQRAVVEKGPESEPAEAMALDSLRYITLHLALTVAIPLARSPKMAIVLFDETNEACSPSHYSLLHYVVLTTAECETAPRWTATLSSNAGNPWAFPVSAPHVPQLHLLPLRTTLRIRFPSLRYSCLAASL